MRLLKRLFMWLIILALLGLLVWAFIPQPAEVDAAAVDRGLLQMSISDEGKTRIKDTYILSAPLAGQLQRITLKQGDAVEKRKTVIAAIEPKDPDLLDPRERTSAVARVNAARSRLEQTDPAVRQAAAELELAQSEYERLKRLREQLGTSQKEVEDVQLLARARTEAYRVAQLARDVARYELQLAESALGRTSTTQPADNQLNMLAPYSGRVLRVFQESTAYVMPGTQLLEIGDPANLEVEMEALSTDAVKVRPGYKAFIERWGGDKPLNAQVRVIEPAGYTKISALGVEEQRVKIILDFTDPPDSFTSLGHLYRVDVRIITWEKPDALKVPTSALFREGDQWAVFLLRDGQAVRRNVTLGPMNGQEAEVLSGLAQGDRVVIHPSDKVKDGVKVKVR